MKISAIALFLILALPSNVSGNEGVTEFNDEAWDLTNARVVEHLGRTSIMGTAVLKDVEFENGVIEFDVAAAAGRNYPGVYFRMQSPDDYEHFYIRPHRTGLYDDALQYSPTIGGVGCWQLYSGPGYTAATEMEKDRWVPVRLEVKGDQARVFLDNSDKPGLVVARLEHGHSKGGIALNSFMSGNAFISNFRYREDDTLVFDPVPERDPAPGVITRWQLSRTLTRDEVDFDLHPSTYHQEPALEWRDVTAHPSGLLDLSRHVKRNRGKVDSIYARTTIRVDEDTVRKYRFGYSDLITIFLNGEPVFSGNSSYTRRDSSFLGILGTFDNVYLPLKKGDNELMVLIADVFGGWGLKFQDTAATFRHATLQDAWRTPEEFRTPETALFDPEKGVLYVSHYDIFNRSTAQGVQSIAKLSLDGDLLDADWATGLFNPTGMALHDGHLFVVERGSVARINTATGEMVGRVMLPAPRFPNDIAIDSSGTVYVSDSARGVIYRSEGEGYAEWLKEGDLEGPNGLHVADGKLFVCDGDSRVKSVELSSGKIATVARLWPGIMDGIENDAAGNLLVSYADGRLFRITPDGKVTRLLDLEPTGTAIANFEFIPERKLLVIPTLRGNTVLAMTLSE